MDFDVLCSQEPRELEPDNVLKDLTLCSKGSKVLFTRAWSRILHHYAATEFTYESDRLIALSGVAKAIELAKGFTYVAGTWKELWPMDLLWLHTSVPLRSNEEDGPLTEAEFNSHEMTRPSQLNVPSWSWAATRSGKQFVIEEIIPRMADERAITYWYLAHPVGFTSPTSTARYTGTREDEPRITLTLRSRVKRGKVVRPRKKLRMTFGVNAADEHLPSSLEVYWDYNPRVGDEVVALSLMRETEVYNIHCALVLMLEEGVYNQDGLPCYRRAGFFLDLSKDRAMRVKDWNEETICLC